MINDGEKLLSLDISSGNSVTTIEDPGNSRNELTEGKTNTWKIW